MPQTFERLFEQANLTPRALAEKAGLQIDRVVAILAGRWLASPEERRKLARALDLPLDEIDWGHTMNPRNQRYHRFGFPGGENSDKQ